MLNLSQEQVAKISEALREEHGANAEEIANTLKRALTVGDLKKALSNVDDSLPVELEVVLEITPEGDCAAQPGLAVHHYQVRTGEEGYPRFTIVGAGPQNIEAYAEAFEIDTPAQQ